LLARRICVSPQKDSEVRTLVRARTLTVLERSFFACHCQPPVQIDH
jgi:hypothetical protein